MVINYFDFFGTRIRPDETDTPLVIDPDAMLARPLSLQRLQPVSRWRAQVSKLRPTRLSFVANLAPSLFFDVLFRQAEQVGRAQQRGQQAVALPLGQRGEALDHVLRQ